MLVLFVQSAMYGLHDHMNYNHVNIFNFLHVIHFGDKRNISQLRELSARKAGEANGLASVYGRLSNGSENIFRITTS